MLHATPFAIRNENDAIPMSVKGGGKGGGLGGTARRLVDSTPMKPGLSSMGAANGPKSTRKALGDLSSSQVNTRLATPAHAPPTTAKKASLQPVIFTESNRKTAPSSSSKPAVASEFDVSDMICSHVGKDEDPFDLVVRKAAKMKFSVAPPSCQPLLDADEVIWREQATDGLVWRDASTEEDDCVPSFIDCELEP